MLMMCHVHSCRNCPPFKDLEVELRPIRIRHRSFSRTASRTDPPPILRQNRVPYGLPPILRHNCRSEIPIHGPAFFWRFLENWIHGGLIRSFCCPICESGKGCRSAEVWACIHRRLRADPREGGQFTRFGGAFFLEILNCYVRNYTF